MFEKLYYQLYTFPIFEHAIEHIKHIAATVRIIDLRYNVLYDYLYDNVQINFYVMWKYVVADRFGFFAFMVSVEVHGIHGFDCIILFMVSVGV